MTASAHKLAQVLLPLLAVSLLGLIVLVDSHHGNAYGRPMNLPAAPLDLTDPDGNPLDLDSFRGSCVFVYFGFLRCTTLCPNALNVLYQLTQANHDPNLRFLFVSIDPARDQPAFLAAYQQAFDPRLTLAIASEQRRKTLMSYYGYLGEPDRKGQIDHSGHLYLIDQQGVLRFLYTSNQRSVPDILSDLRPLLEGAP